MPFLTLIKIVFNKQEHQLFRDNYDIMHTYYTKADDR